MPNQGCLVEGVCKVVLGRATLAKVAKLQVGQNVERWVALKNEEIRYLQDFWDGDRIQFREHIQQTESTPKGLVVFICLEDNTGAVLKDSQMSLTEMGEYVKIPALKVK